MPDLRPLLNLLADGHFHSGEALGRALGVSRAAVWKSLRELPRCGLAVDAVHGRGYRLRAPLELLDLARIEAAIDPLTRAALGPIELLFHVDSTKAALAMKESKNVRLPADSRGD